MNKKALYWILGILAAAVILALVWGAVSAEKDPPAASVTPGTTNHGQMDHGSMGHGAPAARPSDMPEDADLQGYLDEQDTIMAKMTESMDSIEHSGNAAIDFLAGMIPHHESAVEMAESYLRYGGEHEILAPLAREIIAAQTEEIEQMNGMIETLTASGKTDAEQEKSYLDAYDKLMDHSMSHAAADHLDAAFAGGMIMHHQMAVDMAEAILPNTEDEDVKKLAKTIIETQEQEIADMQDMLASLSSEEK